MGETEDNISLVDHLVLVSLCVLLIVTKLGSQNIAGCENQGKQRRLSDH